MADGITWLADDTRSCSFEELRAFEATLSPDVLAEAEARAKAVSDQFDELRRNRNKAVA